MDFKLIFKSLYFQVAILCAIVAVAMAKPQSYGPPPRPAYGVEEVLPPQPFAYQYGVKDGYSGADFDKSETQDAGGNVQVKNLQDSCFIVKPTTLLFCNSIDSCIQAQ